MYEPFHNPKQLLLPSIPLPLFPLFPLSPSPIPLLSFLNVIYANYFFYEQGFKLKVTEL
jgi:hypothetical protein